MKAAGLVLHAVRLLGYADTARVAARASLPRDVVEDQLLDAQAAGHVTWTEHDGGGGWSLTETGRAAGEALLAAELDEAGARILVEAVMVAFDPLNQLVCGACTRWQLADLGIGHEPRDLPGVLADLHRAAAEWAAAEQRLAVRLPRFAGYHARLSAALAQAEADPTWITGLEKDSAHRTWFELHEDLLATLGRAR